MSDQKGECEQAVIAANTPYRDSPHNERLAIAAAIDRLAADVAAIKEAVWDIAPGDNGRFVPSELEWNELVDRKTAAIRERDEARAEVERLKAELHTEIHGHMASRVEVERLRAAPAAPQPATVSDAQAAMDKDRAFVQRQCASERAADAPPAAPQPAAPPAGWLTENEREMIDFADSELSAIGHHQPPDKEQCLRLSAGLRRLVKRHDENKLSRAGSPPVVEVPVMVFGSEGSRSWEMQKRYRAAMDKAGVKWREVGRE